MKQEPGRQQPGISGLQAGEDVNQLLERANGNLGTHRISMTQHQKTPITAPDLLRESAELIESRAVERDVDAERSMARTIEAFNTLTGNRLVETEGWLLLAILKLARATAGKFQPDDLKDCASYVALALECQLALHSSESNF